MIANAPDVDRMGSAHDCGCGCGGTCSCESRCCDLECLIRPNYFCGQTLTDRDLTALVEWARTRFGLVRYRLGWGVVCGLDITCSGPDVDPCCGTAAGRNGQGPSVYVNPGYAVDCCGNDLVVCDPLRVDLSSVCVELPDPCADLPRERRKDPKENRLENRIDEGRSQGEIERLKGESEKDPCLPWTDRANLFAVDLSLRYHEDLFQGQRTMFRNACVDAQPCGYSRIRERPCVHLEVMKDLRASADDREAITWEDDFRKELKAYIEELRQEIGRGDLPALVRYIRQHRPSTLCFIEDYLCCVLDASTTTRYTAWQGHVGGWLMLDWMLRKLRCDCWSCRPDRGVPIGRVILRRIPVRGGVRCRVVMIDTGPRHRRPLEKSCRPIPKGAIDLAPYLWLPIDDVRQQLSVRNVRVYEKMTRPETNRLEESLQPFATALVSTQPGRDVYPVVMDDPLGTTRVAAFLGANP